MKSWNELREKGTHHQLTFHLVCCERFDEVLKRIAEEHFPDFSGKKRVQVVNAILTVMEPFLRHHLNLDYLEWGFSLFAGEGAMSTNDGEEITFDEKAEKEKVLMDKEMWVSLDVGVYRLIKKIHESGECGYRERPKRNGTHSMAVVFRAAMLRAFELIDALGRDGFARWIKKWLEDHQEKRMPRFRKKWKVLEHHMEFFESMNVKYIGLYSGSYSQMHLYHPPPGK